MDFLNEFYLISSQGDEAKAFLMMPKRACMCQGEFCLISSQGKEAKAFLMMPRRACMCLVTDFHFWIMIIILSSFLFFFFIIKKKNESSHDLCTNYNTNLVSFLLSSGTILDKDKQLNFTTIVCATNFLVSRCKKSDVQKQNEKSKTLAQKHNSSYLSHVSTAATK